MITDVIKIAIFVFIVAGFISLIVVEVTAFFSKYIPAKYRRVVNKRCPKCSKGTLHCKKGYANAAEIDVYICDSCDTEFI